MKFAFISDIHGNAVALEAVLEDIEKKKVDKTYVLGDLAYRGPEPKRSIELVQNLNTEVVKGNADEWIVRGVNEGEVPAQALDLMNKERDWTVSMLDEKDIDYLRNLPYDLAFQQDGISLYGFHALPDSLFEVVLPDEEERMVERKIITKMNADIYLYGHIHKSYIRNINGKTLINLGSVGLPFDGIKKASYAIVEVNDGNFSTSIERVDYDTEKVIEKYKEVDYPNKEMMEKIIRTASN